ncbi:hypothetical protein LEP1GSC178_3810 [Leptospira licerasiae str. MMD4847]|uniref:Uncharacterized protein n=1 Tax=Leptospira licerasiae str. MMD4847 TaxID=1049971 RepID=A0ABN0H7P7_9LEPT|nr:hypothetical protein LEP1GSC178_3810 [Leptospira licerasiae str. MMD4847]
MHGLRAEDLGQDWPRAKDVVSCGDLGTGWMYSKQIPAKIL